MISFECSKCGVTLEAEDDDVGATVRCPECQKKNVVPDDEVVDYEEVEDVEEVKKPAGADKPKKKKKRPEEAVEKLVPALLIIMVLMFFVVSGVGTYIVYWRLAEVPKAEK